MNVVKRNGVSAPLDESKILKCIEWACEGLSVAPSSIFDAVRKALYDGIGTKDVHRLTIGEAAGQIAIDNQDANFVAARLMLQEVYKQAANSVHYTHLRAYIGHAHSLGLLSDEMLDFNFEKLNAALDQSRDFLFGYVGIQTLADRYFLRESPAGRIIELPQHFWMRVAMGLALKEHDRTERAIEFYGVLSTLEFVSSTPTLFNSGTRRSQLSSCYGNTVADTITADEGDHHFASIFGNFEECALLSKYAGGIGTDWNRVRAEGDHIGGTAGVSSGIVPYLKVYSDVAVAVNQGGKRKGSFAPYIEPWHPDFEAFLELKKNTGDERKRAHEIYPATWTPDLFMKRVQERGIWSFFSPKDHPDLHELFGIEFEARYTELENQCAFVRQIPAIELWRKWLTMLFETGHPWVTFKDECNRRNPQSHVGVIHNSNLCCVAADQRVVTSRGMKTVGELYALGGDNVVMGLAGPSNAGQMLLPRPDAPIVRIETAEGYSHKVTPDHRVWKKDCGWIEAQHLVAGDKLLIQQGEGLFGEVHNIELGLIAGMVAGDGTYADKSVCIDLWGGKTQKWASAIENAVAIVLRDNVKLVTTSTNAPKFVHSLTHDKSRLSSAPLARLLAENGMTKETKLSIPEFIWNGDKSTVSAYLRGIYLTDGHIQTGDDACCIVLASVSKSLLQDVQILWANLGVKSSLNKMRDAGVRDFGGDCGGEYECKEVWRLLITSIQGCKIAQRVTHLGNFRQGETADALNERVVKKGYAQKLYATFTELTELPNEDAYCLTVDSDTHAWTVNGMVTHNTEITLNNSDSETFVCNLGSVNLSRVSPEKNKARFDAVVKTAMRMLDNVIDINFYPSDRARLANMRHRPVGLGVMGYMEWLVQNDIDFESEAHLIATDTLFEYLSAQVISASIDLAQERGAYESYPGSKWSQDILPIDTARMTGCDPTIWNDIRVRLAKYGIRNSNCMAIAPTATISNIAGTTPCIEAAVDLIYSKTNLSGDFSVVDPTLKYGKPALAKTMLQIDPMWVIRSAAVRQKWLDQAQSTNIWAKRGTKGKDLAKIYETAWELGLKTTYYLRSESASVTTTAGKEEVVMCSIDNHECEACQ